MHEEQRRTEGSLHAESLRRLRRAPARGRKESLVPHVSEADFPIVFRGYEREAVDGFLRDLSAEIAELETTRSSDAVIRHALEEVGEQTSAILQRAHDSAEEITTRSRSRADDRLQQAEHEAQLIVEQAEQRARELDADVERLWQERARLIEDLRHLAEEVLSVADDANDRLGPAPVQAEPDATGDPEPSVVVRPPVGPTGEEASDDGASTNGTFEGEPDAQVPLEAEEGGSAGAPLEEEPFEEEASVRELSAEAFQVEDARADEPPLATPPIDPSTDEAAPDGHAASGDHEPASYDAPTEEHPAPPLEDERS